MITNRRIALAYFYRAIEGFSVYKTAVIFGVSSRTINRWLKKYQEEHPDIPPILTELQKEIRDCFESGLTPQEIALYLKRPLNSVYKVTSKLGLIKKKSKHVHYDPSMDGKVEQKF